MTDTLLIDAPVLADAAHGERSPHPRELAFGELNQWLSYLVRRTDRDITRLFLAEFGWDRGLPPVALSVLMLISASPGLDQQEIAHELGLDKANAARLIRSLDAAGWLVRRHPSQDKRKQNVYVTPQGVHELSKLKREMRRFEQKLIDLLGREQHAVLVGLLEKLHRAQQR